MAVAETLSCIAVILLSLCVKSLDGSFTSTPGNTVGCTSDSVTFNWVYNNPTDADIVSWNFGTQKILDFEYTSGNIIVDPIYTGRVTHNSNGVITLLQLTESDAGDYSCSVTYNSNLPATNTATLTVYKSVSPFEVICESNQVRCGAASLDMTGIQYNWTVEKTSSSATTPTVDGEHGNKEYTCTISGLRVTNCLGAAQDTKSKSCSFEKDGGNLTLTIVLIVILNLLMLLTHTISTAIGLVEPVCSGISGKIIELAVSITAGVVMIVTGILLAIFADKAVQGGQGIAPISTAVGVVVYAVVIVILSAFLTPKAEGWQKYLLIVIAVIILPFGLGLGIRLLICGKPEENNKSKESRKPIRPGSTSCCQTSKVSCMGGNTTEPSRGQGDGKENSPKFTDKRRTTESNATTTGVQLEEKKPTESNVTTIGVQREENKTENKSTTRPQPEPPKQAYENYPEKELDQHTYQNNFRPQPLPPNQDPHYLETLDMSQKNRSNEPHPLEKKGVTNENEEKSKKKKKKKKKNQTADTPRNDNNPAKDKNEVDSKPDNENKDN